MIAKHQRAVPSLAPIVAQITKRTGKGRIATLSYSLPFSHLLRLEDGRVLDQLMCRYALGRKGLYTACWVYQDGWEDAVQDSHLYAASHVEQLDKLRWTYNWLGKWFVWSAIRARRHEFHQQQMIEGYILHRSNPPDEVNQETIDRRRAAARQKLTAMLPAMGMRDRLLLRSCLGLSGEEPTTLRATGRLFKLSTERVRQILAKCLALAREQGTLNRPGGPINRPLEPGAWLVEGEGLWVLRRNRSQMRAGFLKPGQWIVIRSLPNWQKRWLFLLGEKTRLTLLAHRPPRPGQSWASTPLAHLLEPVQWYRWAMEMIQGCSQCSGVGRVASPGGQIDELATEELEVAGDYEQFPVPAQVMTPTPCPACARARAILSQRLEAAIHGR